MNDQEMLGLFKQALDDVVPGKSGQWDYVTLDTTIDDLSVDSVTFMELVGFVEDKTGKVFPDNELANLTSFRDLASLIVRS
jgi:acyl carrier protein